MTDKQIIIKRLLENSSITIEESFILLKDEIVYIPTKEYIPYQSTTPWIPQPYFPQYPIQNPYRVYYTGDINTAQR